MIMVVRLPAAQQAVAKVGFRPGEGAKLLPSASA